jgi:hypothetical protein
MRLLPPIVALLLCAGCHVRAPVPRVRASGTAKTHADVRVDVRARVRVQARPSYRPPPPPQVRPEPVPLEGSAVVEFFGVPLEGAQDVVFLLDRSGSMVEPAMGRIAQLSAHVPATPPPPDADFPMDAQADAPVELAPAPAVVVPRKIDVARRELIEALAQLPAGTRLNVIFFSNWLEAYAPGLTAVDEDNRQDMIHFVDGTEPRGATALATAMRAAFMMGARHVVLLSDGLGNMGGGSEETLRDAREAMRGGLRIDTIGIGPDQDRPLLRALAHESGGLYQAF